MRKWRDRLLTVVLSCTLIGMAICAVGVIAFTGRMLFGTERELEENLLSVGKSDRTTRLYYREGERETEWISNRICGHENALFCPIEEMPEHLKNAFIAIEDKRFYDHGGVDWYRTASAVGHYLGGDGSFGGSTITQQLVKNLTGESERSVRRKALELVRAVRLEQRLDKREILEAYLNVVNLSEHCYGVKTAANAYFSKEPAELTLAECAAIAAITNNPARYDPVRHPEENRKRRDVILGEMHAQGMISRESYEAAVKTDTVLKINRDAMAGQVHSWYADLVASDVIEALMKERGMSRAEASRAVYGGGLKIYTAVDPTLQRIVEAYYSREEHFPKTADGRRVQSGMMILDPKTGGILAVAGAVGEKKANRIQSFATDAKRPTGSVIKPLSVYAPALQNHRITYATVFDDVPLQYRKNGAPWPKNSPNVYRGLINVNEALTHSVNTTSVAVLQRLGNRRAFLFLRDSLGFSSLDEQADTGAAALALGQQSRGVSLREILGGYTAMADGGVYHPPRSFYRVEDSDGRVLLSYETERRTVLSPDTAEIMTTMLRHVMEEGTGKNSRLKYLVDVAGKTGTSSNNCDKWFVGYTPELLAGVWCGLAYPEPLVGIKGNPSLGIFDEVMIKAVAARGVRQKSFAESGDVVTARYCKDSGKLVTEACLLDPRGDRTEIGYFKKGTEPKETCDCHVLVDYCDHGGVATDACPEGCRHPVALLRVKRRFPCQVRVLDAPYSFDGYCVSGERVATEYEPYYASGYEAGAHFGIALDLIPFNHACQAHGNADAFWRRRTLDGA